LAGAKAQVTLTRNVINRNGGDGVPLSAPPGIKVRVRKRDSGQQVHGIGTHAQVELFTSANTVGGNGDTALFCDDVFPFYTLGHNNADGQSSSGTCLIKYAGY
jgi:hypothetical protein